MQEGFLPNAHNYTQERAEKSNKASLYINKKAFFATNYLRQMRTMGGLQVIDFEGST